MQPGNSPSAKLNLKSWEEQKMEIKTFKEIFVKFLFSPNQAKW